MSGGCANTATGGVLANKVCTDESSTAGYIYTLGCSSRTGNHGIENMYLQERQVNMLAKLLLLSLSVSDAAVKQVAVV